MKIKTLRSHLAASVRLLSCNYGRVISFIIIAIGIALGAGSAEAVSATIYSYPLPSIYTLSTNYSLTVNGTSIPVVNYTTRYDYAEFSMSNGSATIQVNTTIQTGFTNITSYNISPEKFGISGTTNGDNLTFMITNNQYLVVQVDSMKPFMLCADPMEMNVPPSSGAGIYNVTNSPYNADNTGSTITSAAIQSAINAAGTYGDTNGQGIVYVPAGVYLCGNLHLTNNVALYLQGGSVIRGTGNLTNYIAGGYYGSLNGVATNGTVFLSASDVTNMEIYGRGTVDGDGYYMGTTEDFGDNLLVPINCTNFTADGITFRDSGGWGLVPSQSAIMLFSNLKIFDNMAVSQDDCMDVVDSQDVTVSNIVGVAGDDTLSTKSYSYAVGNVMFEGCLLWSEAIACKVGWSVSQPQIGVTYSNIVVYNCQNGLGIAEQTGGSSGGSTVGNLTFEDIDVQNTSIGLSPKNQAWALFSIQITNGMATNIMVGNITVGQTGVNGSLGGTAPNTMINGITFSNIFMPGSTLAASNLFQMDIFNQQLYTNLTILPLQSPLPAIYLRGNDPAGSTSFTNAGNWSDHLPPFSGTNYIDAAFVLRTPTNGNAIFAGNSPLKLYDGAVLGLKNDNSTTTVGTNSTAGLSLDNSIVKNVDAASDTLAGYVTLLSDGGIFQMPVGAAYIFTISAPIGGSGGLQAGLTNDTGTIRLSGANSYLGGTTFGTSLGGPVTLQLSGSGTLGSTNGSLTFNNVNDILDLNGTSQGIGKLSGAAGTITNSAASSSTLTIGNGNGVSAFSGVIVNGSGTITLIKAGSGTNTLAGVNTYTGGTTVSAGTLQLGVNNAIPGGSYNGDVTVNGTLDLSNYSDTINALNGSGTVDDVMAGGTPTLTIGGNGDSGTFSGVIQNSSGTLALTKVGTGTEYLTGNNSFTGNVLIQTGQVWIATSTGLGSGTKNVTVQDSSSAQSADAELHLDGTNGNISLASALTFVISNPGGNGAIVNEAGNNTINGNISLTSGGGDSLVTVNAGTLTLAGSITNGTSTFNRGLTIAGSGNCTVSGGMGDGTAGGTFFLTKTNAGVVTLTGNNTYTGGTTISAGTLQLGVNNALPGGSYNGDVTVNGTLDLSNYSDTINALNGSGTVDDVMAGGTPTLTIGGNGDGGTFSGVIQNSSGTLALTKVGAGTEYLTGNNSFTGNVLIQTGQVWIASSTGLGSGTKNVTVQDSSSAQSADAELHLDGTSGNISLASALTFVISNPGGNGAIVNEAGNNTINGNISLTSGGGDSLVTVNAGTLTLAGSITNGTSTFNRGLTIAGSGNCTVSGGMGDGTAGGTFFLTKTNAGVVTLTGNNTYSGGTTVNGGTLALKGPGRSTSLLVTNGATCQVLTTLSVLTNTASVSIGTNSLLNLTNGVNQTVKYLSLNGQWQAAGTWGSSSSPAANKSTYFSGAGELTVSSGGTPQIIKALSVVAPNSPSLMPLFSSQNLTLSWPSSFTGWHLQMQTNGLMNSNWVDVSGATITNQIIIPVSLNHGAVFFRLASP